MPSPHHFDAELRDWFLFMYPTPRGIWPTLMGWVWHDKKGRFADGRLIRTSVLLTPIDDLHAGAIARTLNTRYLLARPAASDN